MAQNNTPVKALVLAGGGARGSYQVGVWRALIELGEADSNIVQALRGDDITLYGDGSQTRSFCYVDDLVECMIRFMASPIDFVGPMNMGNPGEFTIRELAEKVVEMTGSKSVISYEPLPGDDPKQRKPDITLAREKLGWEPKVALEDGLVKTIAYFDQQLKSGMA